VRRVADVGLKAAERVFRAPDHRQVAQLLRERVVGHVFQRCHRVGLRTARSGECGGMGSQGQLRVGVRLAVELFGAQEQRFGRQGGSVRIGANDAVTLLRVLPETLEGGFEVTVQHDGCRIAQVVEHRSGLFEEQGQVVLDTGGGHAIAHVLVDPAFGRVAFEQFAPAAAKLGPRRVVHGEFAARQQTHLGYRVQAALAVGVEGADAVDFVVEQIHAIGHQGPHGEQVDQATAHSVFARADDLGHVLVAGQGELAFELGFVELLLDLEMEGVAGQKGRWRQPVERRGRRHEHHVGTAVAVLRLASGVDTPERGQTFGDQVLVGREAVVGQGFPIGEQGDAQVGREEPHFIDQALGIGGVGGDDGRQAALGLVALGQLGEQQGVGRAGGTGQGEAFAGVELGQVHQRVSLVRGSRGRPIRKPPVPWNGGCCALILE
jgi:hypothetical protein